MDVEFVQENAFNKFVQSERSDSEHSNALYDRFSSDNENSDDTDNSSDDKEVTSAIANDLRKWARESMIPYTHIDSLLQV